MKQFLIAAAGMAAIAVKHNAIATTAKMNFIMFSLGGFHFLVLS